MSLAVTIRKNQDELPTSIMLDRLSIEPTDPSFFKYVILESVNFDLPKRLCRIVLTGGTSKEISLSDKQVLQLQNTDNTNTDLLNRLQSIVYSALGSPEDRQICENALLEVYKIKGIPTQKYKLFKASQQAANCFYGNAKKHLTKLAKNEEKRLLREKYSLEAKLYTKTLEEKLTELWKKEKESVQ